MIWQRYGNSIYVITKVIFRLVYEQINLLLLATECQERIQDYK